MQKKKATEEGFLTKLEYDTKNEEFLKEDIYYCIDKLEVYYTTEGILGLFPSYEDQELNKKIEENSFYLEFQKNLSEIKRKLKNKKLELKHEVTNLNEYIHNIHLIYDENKQRISALKIITLNKNVNIYGNFTLFNKHDYTNLNKMGHFITGLKTTYTKTKDGIPYLSYVKGYFGDFDEYNKYYYHNDNKNCCTHLFEKFLRALIFPFILFDKCFVFCVRSLILISKISFILSLIFGLPVYYYWTTQNILTGNYLITPNNSDYVLKNKNTSPIKIYTDEHGFSHIKASNREDAYFGLGFEHAKHRLFQIDMNRRIAKGTLSEVFGKRTLETDKFMRKLGYNHYCQKAYDYFRKNSQFQKEVEAYISGINYFGNNFKLPIEYYITGADFMNFTVHDVLTTITMFSFSMNNDYDIELLYQFLEREIGKDFVEYVFNFRDKDYPFWNESIINDDELFDMGLSKIKKKVIEEPENLDLDLDIKEKEKEKHKENDTNIAKEKEKEVDKDDLKIVDEDDVDNTRNKPDEKIIGNRMNNAGASNCWNIAGKYTKSGKPLLCNDPHLPNSQPNVFFAVKLYMPDNIISGASLAGTPIFITGSNSYLSWGLTTENTDNTDLCEEIVQGDYYIKDNKHYPLIKVKEVIKIKGSEPYEFVVKYTENGPILGKNIPGVISLFNEEYESEMPLSLRVGFMKHDFSIDFYFRANLAHEPNDFLPYRSQCLMSNFNFHYATKSGDIGYFTMGIINLKKYQDRFCHGFSSKDDIINEVPQDELLFITNPKKGYIVSANNKPVTENYLYKLVGNHNNARAHRINELLSEYIKNNTKISVKEATEIVKDVKDSNAQYIIPKYLTILRKKLNAKELREDALFLMLAKWDYKYTPESRGATLWSVLERNLCTFILTRNLTNLDKYKLVLNYYPYYKFIHGLIDKISRGEKVMLRKCAVFNDNEDCEKYLVDVFVHLGMDIQKYLDSSGDVKKWGEVNYNYFPHTPFEDIPILKYFYSRKKYVGGNKDTVKISRSPGNSKYGDFVGMQTPKGQFVYDMADPEQPYLIIVGGNGGSPMQQYYNNLMDEFEQKKLIKFKNIDFNDPKYQERIITLEKRRN